MVGMVCVGTNMAGSSTEVLLGESGRGGVSIFSRTVASSGGKVASG